MTPSAPVSPSAALVKPRLILRLGVVGNQFFGNDEEVARGRDWVVNEESEEMRQEVERQCGVIFHEVKTCLKQLHQEDQQRRFSREKHGLAGLFAWTGFAFRLRRLWTPNEANSAAVFSEDGPVLQVLTGVAKGVDEIAVKLADAQGHGLFRLGYDTEGSADPELAVSYGKLPAKPRVKTALLDRETAAAMAEVQKERKAVLRAQAAGFRHHSDVLLAVWDPAADAKAAGTVEAVLAALNENIPVIAVRLDSMPAGSCSHIQILRHTRDLEIRNDEQDWKTELQSELKKILAFPEQVEPAGHGKKQTEYQPLAAYHRFTSGEPFPRLWPGLIWQWFGMGEEAATSATATGTTDQAPELHAARRRATEATRVFGHAHRGGIILTYSLAALAVVLAVAGHLCESKHEKKPADCQDAKIVPEDDKKHGIQEHEKSEHASHHSDEVDLARLQTCCTGTEVVCVILMGLLAFRSRKENWHHAYTDARLLAEALRVMPFLSPLGLHAPLPKLPAYLKHHADLPLPRQPWTVWYLRALVRMQPLSRGECKGHLKRLTDDWLAGQIQHHERNSKRHGHLHHEVERLAWALFLIVAFAAVLHLGHPKFGCFNPATWLYILCVCVPVMIASVHGMASQLESNRLHLRSDSLRQLLETSKERLDVLKDKEGSTTLEATLSELSISDGAGTTGVAAEVTVSATCAGGLTAADWRFVQAEALHAASLMIDETAAWSLLYKNAAIPAG